MKKRILSILLFIAILFTFTGCREYEKRECYVCGKEKNCYKLTATYKGETQNRWICSEKCEKQLRSMGSLIGVEYK